MTTRRNSGGQRVRNVMLKDLDQFDRQLENTINTINTISAGNVKGLDPVTTFFFPELSLFIHFSWFGSERRLTLYNRKLKAAKEGKKIQHRTTCEKILKESQVNEFPP